MNNENSNFNFKAFDNYKCDGQLVMRFTDENQKIIIEEETGNNDNDKNTKINKYNNWNT